MISEKLFFRTRIEQTEVRFGVLSASRKFLCDFNQTSIGVRYPFLASQDERHVFTVFDTFSLSVLLFFCVTLSELYQDKRLKTEEFLWSLGVSNSEQMISWYICQVVQAMIWSAINLVHILPQTMTMSTNIVFLWFLYVLVFLSTAIFALFCNKFVRGTMSYLFAITQMIMIWLFLYVWSTLELPLPNSQALRNIILIHPVAQSRNVFMLTQAAEFSHVGLSMSSLTTSFNREEKDFFGNGLETLLLLLLVSVVCSILFLINFQYFWDLALEPILRRKKLDNINGSSQCYQDIEMTTEAPPVVEVDKLSMAYPNGFQALANVSFSIYPGEIVGLLGKNGAGKSTTMNIIAGFYEATAGCVKVGGIDLKYDRTKALNNLSFCPQDDRFFYRLTVLEHLRLVCLLKNASYERSRADYLLKFLNLSDKQHSKPRNISGGQKRRVCIAMAYIANSPLIILDEPTSAVDAATRKTLWSFFQAQQKSNPEQAVILCTHFMQEADVLSQRIAIIAEGQLRAIGSSTYLKSLFGVGYTFTYEKRNANVVRSIVTKVCPDAKFPQTEDSASFQVPMEQAGQLPEILSNLDNSGIEYSFNAATLENVFVALSTNLYQNELVTGNGNEQDQVDQTTLGAEIANFATQSDQRNSFISWLIQQSIFSFYVDFLRIFVENWMFFVIFTIIFLAFPQLVMLLCTLDASLFTNEDLFDHGNISVTPSTFSDDPKVAIFGNVPASLLQQVERALRDNEMEPVTDRSLSEMVSDYEEKPLDVINTYPFFLNYSSDSEVFDCLVNNHFDSSLLFCMSFLFNIYYKSEFSTHIPLKVGVTYYPKPESNDTSYYWQPEPEDENESEKQCKGWMFYYLMCIVYFCLLFFIVRVESARNEIGLTSFYRANGAHPMFSFAYRVATLFFITFVYFFVILLMTEEVPYYFDPDKGNLTLPNYSMVGSLLLFSLTFTCFAVLLAKFIRSVIMQLFLTLILGILYLILFQSDLRDEMIDFSKWFYLLKVPGYVIPVGPIGLLLAFDETQVDTANITWAIQFLVFFPLILLIESMLMRIGVNFISNAINSSSRNSGERNDNSTLAICARNIYHTYFQFEIALCCCCKNNKFSLFKFTKALKGMNLNIKQGECYALLGVNGAGKSTMFEILTGGNRLQEGSIRIFGKSVHSNPLGVLKDIGYCSQLDKVPTYLKAATVVELFGYLRGLSSAQVYEQMGYMCRILDVGQHMHKFLGGCSGGTKRKVSTMVAFIGFPKLIILDESTTGMFLSYLKVYQFKIAF